MELTRKEIEQITFALECILQDEPIDEDGVFVTQLIKKLEVERERLRVK